VPSCVIWIERIALIFVIWICLQWFDTLGWVAGRASGL